MKPSAKKEAKRNPLPQVKAGQNVIADIDGKEVGPIYLAQICEGVATLQGKDAIRVPLSDVRPLS